MARHMTILAVDDEIEILHILSAVMGARGYDMLQADTSAEALHLCQTEQFDLMISDITMPPGLPAQTATAMADCLAMHRPLVPVIFMSGYCSASLVKHLAGRGFARDRYTFLAKPFTIGDLRAAVAIALN